MNKMINKMALMVIVMLEPVYADEIQNQFDSAFGKDSVIMPTASELLQARQAFQKELSGKSANELWHSLGMQSSILQGISFIRETADKRIGRGMFSLRLNDKVNPWLLQATHAKSDKYTGRLAVLLFAQHQIKAAMWNSVPRKTPLQYSSRSKTADMAHLTATYWQEMTGSFARLYPQGRIIQLHGYAQSKRKTAAGSASDMIISAGHSQPSPWVQEFTRCLKKFMPAKVSLYPYDVRELGATTNVQGHLLQKMDFDGFVHIEMSKPFRKMLLNRIDLRQKLLNCMP